MRVRPVYQTLHATRMEQRCKTPDGIVVVEPKDGEKGRFERFVDAVRDVLSPEEIPRTVDAVPRDAIDCDVVQVEREFRRAIAYDVDYVYKGAKYRSRLPHDPGNHVRVRVSVTPMVGPVGMCCVALLTTAPATPEMAPTAPASSTIRPVRSVH